MNTIPQHALEEQPRSDYYTYVYYRSDKVPGQLVPFYVGKGRGDRVNQHMKCAHKRDTCNHLTCRVIRKVEREGGEIAAIKIAEGIPEQQAFQMEKLFISFGAIYGWPLVNKTFGGDGVSGYRYTEEQRQERKRLAQQLVQEGRFDHLKVVNKGCKCPPEIVQRRTERVTEAWTDPKLIEGQRQRQIARWSNPEELQRQKERFADPELRAKCGAANKGKESIQAKTYPGFMSPNGTIYSDVRNLTHFARQHGLQKSGLCLVAQGKQSSHLGWTLYPPIEKHPYKGTGFVSPTGNFFADIPHLSKFCEQHGLRQNMMSEVANGKRKSHKGWTRHEPRPTQMSLFDDIPRV